MDKSWFLLVFIVAFIAGTILYYGHAKSECDDKGGVLVVKVGSVGYSCVKELK